MALGRRSALHGIALGLRLCERQPCGFALQEARADHVRLDDLADRGKQTWHVAPRDPMAALRVEYGLQLFGDEGDIAAAPEHGADHARQRHRPGVMLEVTRVHEDLEGAAAT